MAEDRRQMTDDRRQMADDRGQKADFGLRILNCARPPRLSEQARDPSASAEASRCRAWWRAGNTDLKTRRQESGENNLKWYLFNCFLLATGYLSWVCRRTDYWIFWLRIANIDNKKSEANAPLVLLKMNRFISRSTLVCWGLYLAQHRSPIFPCTLCYKTRKGPSYQRLSHKVGWQRQTLCIENKAKPIYPTLDNEDNLST